MKLISFLLRSARAVVILAIVAGLIAGVSNTALLILINHILTGVGTSRWLLAAAFAAVCLIMLLSRLTSTMLLIRLSRGSIFDLRIKLSRQILAAPLRHLEQLGAARLLATLTDDVSVIGNGLINIPTLCIHLVVVTSCLVYLCWLSWTVFAAVLAFMVLGVLSYQFVLSMGHRHLQLSRQEWDALFGHLQALTDGAKELKLNSRRREAFLTSQLEQTAEALRHHGYLGDRNYALAIGWGQLLVFMLLGLLLLGLPVVTTVAMKTFIGYTLVILYIMSPLEAIMNIMPIVARTNVALQKVDELGLSLQEKSTETSASDEEMSTAAFERLELLDVTHTYYREDKQSDFQLGPITLSLSPGEIVFLIGGNGSGKTTLAKLLTGLYSPESGEIRLDGRLIEDSNRETYRQLFSAIFTDSYLFEHLLGLDGPELDAQARSYLIELQLDHKLQVNDGKLSTLKLSHGQRKRLSLLAAYLEDRPFYVFDEWAADQDPTFKEIFYLKLLPELKARGKAVLVISHDDHYYDVADRVIKLDYGKVDCYELALPPEFSSHRAAARW